MKRSGEHEGGVVDAQAKRKISVVEILVVLGLLGGIAAGFFVASRMVVV